MTLTTAPVWNVCTFKQLNNATLYEILRLRAEVFVVEQQCIYQDMDGKDRDALHLFGKLKNEICAYTRILPPGKDKDYCSFGRVLVGPTHRKLGLAHLLIKETLKTITREYGRVPVKISAQTYLQDFYKKHGFKLTGTPFLEDGIPHVYMLGLINI